MQMLECVFLLQLVDFVFADTIIQEGMEFFQDAMRSWRCELENLSLTFNSFVTPLQVHFWIHYHYQWSLLKMPLKAAYICC